MPAGGDVHIIRQDGVGFDFLGEPGEVYNYFTAHNIASHLTVLPIGEGGSYVNRLIVHLPNNVDITVWTDRLHVETLDHKVVVRIDPGHTEPEGEVRPDPLIGVPHLEFDVLPKVGLEGASGLKIDGGDRPESDFKIGVRWD